MKNKNDVIVALDFSDFNELNPLCLFLIQNFVN